MNRMLIVSLVVTFSSVAIMQIYPAHSLPIMFVAVGVIGVMGWLDLAGEFRRNKTPVNKKEERGGKN